MNKQAILERLRSKMAEIRERFAVSKLSVFGSVARNDTTASSDIDVLVEFKGKATFDLFMDLKFYLEELLGANVDLVTHHAVRPEMRQRIEQEKTDVA